MSSITESDTYAFPTISMPVTVVLIGVLLFVIFAGFFSLFFWRFLLNRLSSAWNLQRTTYDDLMHISTLPENSGLDPIIIRSFPEFHYSSETLKHQRTECAICLSEFSYEDTVRLITVCRHAFHSNCIDLWFELHKTCPVCRCELDPGLIRSGSKRDHPNLLNNNAIMITIQDEENPPPPSASASSSKRVVVETSAAWRFPRSYSTGHFMVKTSDVNNMKIQRRRHYQTGSCVSFEELARYGEAGWLGGSSHSCRIEV